MSLPKMSSPLKRLQALKPFTLNHSSHIAFRRWLHLYKTRFPYQELAPITSIAKSINKSESLLTGLIDCQSNQWAGFTLVEMYGSSNLLAYLATAPDFEGQGLARKMVGELVSKSLSETTPYFWLEASPKLWKFYSKLGFKRLAIEYRIPEFYGKGTEKMGLFVRLHPSISHIEKKVVESFVSKLLLSGYGIKKTDRRYEKQMAVIQSYPHTVVETH